MKYFFHFHARRVVVARIEFGEVVHENTDGCVGAVRCMEPEAWTTVFPAVGRAAAPVPPPPPPPAPPGLAEFFAAFSALPSRRARAAPRRQQGGRARQEPSAHEAEEVLEAHEAQEVLAAYDFVDPGDESGSEGHICELTDISIMN